MSKPSAEACAFVNEEWAPSFSAVQVALMLDTFAAARVEAFRTKLADLIEQHANNWEGGDPEGCEHEVLAALAKFVRAQEVKS